jgi:retinol-binding protein 3
LVIGLSNSGTCQAQDQKESTDVLDVATRSEVIEVTLKRIGDSYVFPDVAKQIETVIRGRLQRKEYDRITDPTGLAEMLTAQLQEISHDKHMRVSYYRKPLPPPPSQDRETPQAREKRRYVAGLSNFGFNKVVRLGGNVGYLDLNIFWWLDIGGGDTAVAAMNFLSNTSSIIIDLRNNRGGDPAMVALLASYFFDSEPVELSGLYWRPTDSLERAFTLAYIPGRRYLNKDVYILTSKETFSAGEAFAYDLKNLRRATIIGETTAGGANPRTGYPINQNFIVFVPTGRAISPITKTNWEGVGVKPDVEVSGELALKTAHLMALKKLREHNTDDSLADEIKSAIETIEKELNESKKEK